MDLESSVAAAIDQNPSSSGSCEKIPEVDLIDEHKAINKEITMNKGRNVEDLLQTFSLVYRQNVIFGFKQMLNR